MGGDYTLTEVTAPAGYVLDTSAHTFVVGATALTVDLAQITNARETGVVPPPPSTNSGGMATGMTPLAITGGGLPIGLTLVATVLSAIGIGIFVASRHRRHRDEQLLEPSSD
ncbi:MULTISPECIES: prealbumin-like fold domain-containing protein [unclassified Microbacterium]|uniref:prealbumin-like fold domain-containing protein n=1 Tax=unclassified Microbacterium TaxID=2609290 RepID=UPI000CFB28D0|nr:hypothetical protein CQ032_15180 [Microbacterium sp. MYb43]PRB19401.1 hypothetical protein CQ040_15830 [Microbacterium sp. MYb54]PRB24602.1 hypothetical protein CQ037_16335 [Microbacterium sp. MYb50]PRB63713.1 hypothetical protein CQ021_15940 [Microbacterium sp. MYb24]